MCGGKVCAGMKIDGCISSWGNSYSGGDKQKKDITNMVQGSCGGMMCAGLKTD